MTRLKVITLEVGKSPKKTEYKAIDTDGKVLTTRHACRAGNGKAYIAALITKNTRDHYYGYSMATLFTAFHRISTKENTDKRRKPYAIAILEEHKEAYKEWRRTNANPTSTAP